MNVDVDSLYWVKIISFFRIFFVKILLENLNLISNLVKFKTV